MFNYQITIDEMKRSPNVYIKENGLVYNGDRYGQGLEQLYGDYIRGFVVLGRDGVKDLSCRQRIHDFFHCQSGIHNLHDFIRFIKKNASAHEVGQLAMYSQACMLMMGAIGYTPDSLDIKMRIGQPPLADRAFVLERKLETIDGEVVPVIYQRLRIHQHAIHDSDGRLIGYVPGPTEALFKLTEQGFAFQWLKTDSELIRNLYLYDYTADELYLNFIQSLLNKANLGVTEKENLQLVADLINYVDDNITTQLKNEIDRLQASRILSEPAAIAAIRHAINAINDSMKEHVDHLILARSDKPSCQRIIQAIKTDICHHLHHLHTHPALDVSFSQQVKKAVFDFIDFIDVFGIFKRKNEQFSSELTYFNQAKSSVAQVERRFERKEFSPR